MDYSAALGKRTVTYFRLDKDPIVPFRLTGQKNTAKDGSVSYGVEVFSVHHRIGARFFLTAAKEEIPAIVLWMWASGMLSGLETVTDDEKPVLCFSDIAKGVYDDIIAGDGTVTECAYVRQRRLQEEEINFKELEARRAFMKRFLDLYGQTPVCEFSKHDFQVKLVETLRFRFRNTSLPRYAKKVQRELSKKTVLN